MTWPDRELKVEPLALLMSVEVEARPQLIVCGSSRCLAVLLKLLMVNHIDLELTIEESALKS